MELATRIAKYLEQPAPLWDIELTRQLVITKLRDMSGQNCVDHSLTYCITQNSEINEISYEVADSDGLLVVEPSQPLYFFYKKHGLNVIHIDDYGQIILKVQNALSMLDKVSPVSAFIKQIVKSVQILQASDPETDTSYSHPDIPFSIFFSVCLQNAATSDLRVAESILHEAMHLKLTLIECYCPLVEPDTKHVYYSPWRDEERPIRGVLHGLFVFRAIADFYSQLSHLPFDYEIVEFLKRRIYSIYKEMSMLHGFAQTPGLTKKGEILVNKLLA